MVLRDRMMIKRKRRWKRKRGEGKVGPLISSFVWVSLLYIEDPSAATCIGLNTGSQWLKPPPASASGSHAVVPLAQASYPFLPLWVTMLWLPWSSFSSSNKACSPLLPWLCKLWFPSLGVSPPSIQLANLYSSFCFLFKHHFLREGSPFWPPH